MRGSGRMGRAGSVALAGVAAVTGVVTGSVAPASADCGMRAPDPRIAGHRGFAFEGLIRDISVEPDGNRRRLTLEVIEMLMGEPAPEVVFDLGNGDCWVLQADRYKVGDRLLVTATAPASERAVPTGEIHLPDALSWRHEWSDVWSFHGIPEQRAAAFSPSIRRAATRDDIVALIAPEALPYRIDPDAWSVALRRPDDRVRLRDVVSVGDGFVALGTRTMPRRGDRPRSERTVIWRSADGRRWTEIADPFPDIRGAHRSVHRLLAFQDRLLAVGRDAGTLAIWRSDDGTRWTRTVSEPVVERVPGDPSDDHQWLSFVGMAAGPDGVVILGKPAGDPGLGRARAWTSDDGSTWTSAIPTGLTANVGGIAATSQGFALRASSWSGDHPSWTVLRSTDGVRWEPGGVLPDDVVDMAEDLGQTRLLALVEEYGLETGDRARLDGSPDGTDWTRLLTSPGIVSSPIALAADDGTWVVLGDRSARPPVWSMSSSDAGTTWTRAYLPEAAGGDCITHLALGPRAVVAVGGCDGVLAWVAAR